MTAAIRDRGTNRLAVEKDGKVGTHRGDAIVSDGVGQQGRAGGSGRRRYRVAGSGDWAAEVASRDLVADEGAAGEHVTDLVAGYALDALDADERRHVERHVRRCAACARLITADARVVGFLPYLAPAIAPAPDVKAALFARIAHAERAVAEAPAPRLPLQPPLAATPTLPASRPLPPSAAVSVAGGEVPVASQGLRPAPNRLAWATSFLSIPLLLALAAVGAWGFQMQGDAAEADARWSEVQAQFASFANGEQFNLEPSAGGRGAEGTITVSPDGRRLLLSIQVNNPRQDRTYQLLVQYGERLIPQQDIKVGPNGKVMEIVELDRPYSDYEGIEVKALPVTGENSSDSLAKIAVGDVAGSIGGTEPSASDLLP